MADTQPTETKGINHQMEEAKTSARHSARFFTFLYIVLFPILFGMAWFSPMIFDCPVMTVPVGLSIIFLTYLIPLSIPMSIYLMWSRYSQGLYKKVHFFSILPILTFIVVFVLIEALDKLVRYFA